jgi:hypothetical protein
MQPPIIPAANAPEDISDLRLIQMIGTQQVHIPAKPLGLLGNDIGTAVAGDMIYASAANTWARLAKGTALQHLRMNSGATAPEWASYATIESLEGLTLAAGDILYATGADTLARLPKGTALQHLRQNTALTAPEWATAREVLTANRTYYVRTDGSDSNDGLANTSGGALLTLQAAWNKVAALDLSTYTITVKVADGTYTAGILMSAMPVGGSSITIEGNTTTPGNCYLDMTSSCFRVAAPLPCGMNIKGFKLRFAGASASAITITAPGTIATLNMELVGGSTGFAGAYYAGERGARIVISTGQTISGGMSCFVQADGGVIQFFGITVTLTGTPAWSWLGAIANNMGLIMVSGVTFSGAATGVRYNAQTAGGINTGGGGASYIPGNSAGSVTSPGWYL